MNTNLTPIEAFRYLSQQQPYLPAIRSGNEEWCYAALWKRTCDLTYAINEMDTTRRAVGLFIGLDLDYFTGAHAIWLAGRTVVLLKEEWTPSDIRSVIQQAEICLILHGERTPFILSGVPNIRTSDFLSRMQSPLPFLIDPDSLPPITAVPIICSITPTKGISGVSCKIVNYTKNNLYLMTEDTPAMMKVNDTLSVSSQMLELSRIVLPDVALHPHFIVLFPQQLQPENELLDMLDLQATSDYSSWPQDIDSDDAETDGVLEVSLSISEKISKLSVPYVHATIDMPLTKANLSYNAMLELHSWLRTSFDWSPHIDGLFGQNVTAHSLARNILGVSPRAHASDTRNTSKALGFSNVPMNDYEDIEMQAPETEISLPSINLPSIPDNAFVKTTSSRKRRRNTRTLSVLVEPPREQESLIPISILSPSLVPLPASPAHFSTYPDIGMAPFESWSGKKAGFTRPWCYARIANITFICSLASGCYDDKSIHFKFTCRSF
ncbi:hypothetical protein C8Q75DRAFT_496963 [Abortiporus biennis]|nr:hypothetical protein C8Q75DRAFT_496963 [Abortiporus biennis]